MESSEAPKAKSGWAPSLSWPSTAFELPDLVRQRFKLLARGEHQLLEGDEVPDLGRQRQQLLAVAEIQRLEGKEPADLGRQRPKLPAVAEVQRLFYGWFTVVFRIR